MNDQEDRVDPRVVSWRRFVANHRWRVRLAVWSAFGVVAWTHPFAPDEGRGYLVGLVVLTGIVGLLLPRPFLATGVGLLVATLVRIVTLDAAHYPYTSIELVTVPVIVLPTRALAWALFDRRSTSGPAEKGQLEVAPTA